MPKFALNKLVRDKMPKMYENIDQKAVVRRFTDDELAKALSKKIIEEAKELSVLKNKPEIVNEIADIQQALYDLKTLHGISDNEVIEAQAVKKAEKGGFLGGYFVEVLELEDDDKWIAYYRQEPEKYPEIKDSSSEEQFDIPDIETGEYVHVKSGKEYRVLGVSCHSETLEWGVVYEPLYDHAGMPDMWIRPYEMFFEEIDIDGSKRTRFEKIESEDNKRDT